MDSVYAIRGNREQAQSARVRRQAEADLERVRDALERIRRMTRIYQEREDGKRRDD